MFEKVQAIRLERSNVVPGDRSKTRKSTRYSMKEARQTAGETAVESTYSDQQLDFLSP